MLHFHFKGTHALPMRDVVESYTTCVLCSFLVSDNRRSRVVTAPLLCFLILYCSAGQLRGRVQKYYEMYMDLRNTCMPLL